MGAAGAGRMAEAPGAGRGGGDAAVVRRRRPGPGPRRPPDAPAAHRGPAPRRAGQLRPLLPRARLRPPGRGRPGRLAGPARPRPLGPRRPGELELRAVRRRRPRLLRRPRDRPAGGVRPLPGRVRGHALRGPPPGHAGALVLPSTHGRFGLDRIVEGFRRGGGDEVAATAERVDGGDRGSVTDEQWARWW